MRRCIIAVIFATAALSTPVVSFASAAATEPTGASRQCPDSHVLIDKEPLITSKGQRLGVAKLFAGASMQTDPASPGFCFEVSVRARYRQRFAPIRKKLSVTSPATSNPNVVGTTESSARQFPLGSYASYFGPGCTARATAVIKVEGKRATAVVRGAL